ncbi:MAG: site-specific integrase [Hydrogenophilales bacterium]|nr:site-specific integrase [Hydrogenophilales bacterium]
MATIRQRGNKWQAQVRRLGFPPISQSFQSRQDAEKWARAVEREQDMGAYVCRTEAESTTLSLLIERYKVEVVPAFRGAHTEVGRLANIAIAIGKLSLTAITPLVVASYRDQRLRSVTPSTVLRELQTLSAMLNHARREWGIPISNAVEAIRRPSPNRARDRRLEPEEETRLMDALDSKGRNDKGQLQAGTRNPWIKPIVRLALETAMRRGELLSLRWKNINIDNRTAYLPMTKNGESRTIPLSSAAKAVLQGLPRSIDGRVFPVPGGHPNCPTYGHPNCSTLAMGI